MQISPPIGTNRMVNRGFELAWLYGRGLEDRRYLSRGQRGHTLDCGLRYPQMATDQTQGVAELDDAFIIIGIELKSAVQVVPVLEMALTGRRPLLIVAGKLEGGTLSTVMANVMRDLLFK